MENGVKSIFNPAPERPSSRTRGSPRGKKHGTGQANSQRGKRRFLRGTKN